MPIDLELWNKLKDFELDDEDAHLSFTARLAHENGWTKGFARRALSEYKKFVYLAATSETPLTPSDIVDQVWHLHLTFTRSYWNDMCANLLGHPMHHGPTKGGAREDAKYRKQYAETLTLYRSEFGTEAPSEFWPSAEERFASAPHQRWVDARTHFIIRRPKFSALWTAAAVATTGAAAAGTAAAADGAADTDSTTALVLGGGAAVALLLFATMFSGKSHNRKRRSKNKGASADGSFVVTSGGGTGGKSKGEGGEDGGGDGGGCGGGGGCGS